MKYEDLSDDIKANMKSGHVLAIHTVIGSDLRASRHLTTVQLGVAQDEKGRSVSYCNDVCGDLCEPNSVELMVMDFTGDPLPGALETGRVRVEGTVESRQLEEFRAWTYERYRRAVHGANAEAAAEHGSSLFFLATDMRPEDDYELFARFCEFLAGAAVDQRTMPDFPLTEPDAEADCG